MAEAWAYVTGLLAMILGVVGVILVGGLTMFLIAGLFIFILTVGPKFLKWVCIKCGAAHLFQP